jgi:Pretoxin HINT domain
VGIGWTQAQELQAGDQVLQPDGQFTTVLSRIREEHPEDVTVFNLRVENTHSYFVQAEGSTAEPVCVHNANYADARAELAKSKGAARKDLNDALGGVVGDQRRT